MDNNNLQLVLWSQPLIGFYFTWFAQSFDIVQIHSECSSVGRTGTSSFTV